MFIFSNDNYDRNRDLRLDTTNLQIEKFRQIICPKLYTPKFYKIGGAKTFKACRTDM